MYSMVGSDGPFLLKYTVFLGDIRYIITGWWFQPIRKILVKIGIFPN